MFSISFQTEPDSFQATLTYTDEGRITVFEPMSSKIIERDFAAYQALELDAWDGEFCLSWGNPEFIYWGHSYLANEENGTLTHRVPKTAENMASLLSCLAKWKDVLAQWKAEGHESIF
jgi:hypothetical protein